MTDVLDEYLMGHLSDYDDKKFSNASKEDLKMSDKDESERKRDRVRHAMGWHGMQDAGCGTWWAGCMGGKLLLRLGWGLGLCTAPHSLHSKQLATRRAGLDYRMACMASVLR